MQSYSQSIDSDFWGAKYTATLEGRKSELYLIKLATKLYHVTKASEGITAIGETDMINNVYNMYIVSHDQHRIVRNSFTLSKTIQEFKDSELQMRQGPDATMIAKLMSGNRVTLEIEFDKDEELENIHIVKLAYPELDKLPSAITHRHGATFRRESIPSIDRLKDLLSPLEDTKYTEYDPEIEHPGMYNYFKQFVTRLVRESE